MALTRRHGRLIGSSISSRCSAVKPEPSDREKVFSMKDAEELEGAQGQFRKEGRLTKELDNLIILRMQQLRSKP